jgi:aconitate hydratase
MVTFDIEKILKAYEAMPGKIAHAHASVGRPLTLAEKILYSHVACDPLGTIPGRARALPLGGFRRGVDYVEVLPDRVGMQDATAQMALLQLMTTKLESVRVPTTVHCDHLIEAKENAASDLARAVGDNAEVYDFLSSCSQKYGIGFWKPGSGIIHQVILENYAFPGGLLIGTDSHTPNAGGLGMFAAGVGGADAVDVMVGMPWEVRWPKILGVKLTGKLQGWASPKDVILKLAGMLSVSGGTGFVVEYFGEGTESISATGKGTICNMGAEIGATCSLFPFDKRIADYLRVTERDDVARAAEAIAEHLKPDSEVLSHPDKFYDKVVEIDLSTLEPQVNGPFSPDKAHSLKEFAAAVKRNNWPSSVSAALIGSCTNSSYEDMERVKAIARSAVDAGVVLKTDLLITPGSERIRATLERDGHLGEFQKLGARVFANACGPCIGQWSRGGSTEGKDNSIVTSFNRNFSARNDGNAKTCAFVASPETVIAFALTGDLTVDFVNEGFLTKDGKRVKFDPPVGAEFPLTGYAGGRLGFVPPNNQGARVYVKIDSESKRLQKLLPFENPDMMRDFSALPLLIKVQGKCTTDHISPAGKWLQFRGHLDAISNNLLLTAVNFFSGKANDVKNVLTGKRGTIAEVARSYKDRKQGWVIVAEDNYGEGSSREHAAMEPRYLGCKIVIAKSFARIHETNLKKQGILAFTFANASDYESIMEDDRLTIDAQGLCAGKPAILVLRHADGCSENITLNHTFSDAQLAWFKAGSALNVIAI